MDYDKLAKQFGGTIQQTSNLDDLAKQFGGSVQSMQPENPKVSGLQSFIQDVAEPFLKLPTTVAALGAKTIALGAEAFGRPDIAQRLDKTVDEGIDYGYFGNVKPMGSLKEAFGTGAEIGSYFIGGGGGGTALKTGLKGLIGRGVKEGIATGVSSGALMGFGDSMQQAESKPMDVAYNTLFGAGIGGVAGGVLGGAIPVVTKGAKEVAKFAKVPELQTKLSEGYQKIFNPTARQIKADTRFGNNSFDFLAQEMPDTPLKVNSAGRVEADEAIEMAKMKYSAEAAAYKPIIRNSGKYIDIDEAIAVAKANAKKEFDGTDLIKAEQQIDNEVNAYLANTPQDVNVLANGKRFVTLARADDIKSYSWARGKGWGTPEAEVWNDTNNIIGHALKDSIEKELPDAPIKAMNRRLGQWKNAIDMLEKRNGQATGTGGRLSKLFKTQTGSIVGGLIGTGTGDDNRIIGGITGAGAGFMTASALAAVMSNPNVRLFAVRQLLQRLNKAGRKDMIKEAEQILQQQASKYLLPAAGKSSYVEKPIIVGKPGQRLESTGTRPVVQSSPSALQAKAPSVAPTTQDIKNSTITNSVDQSVKNASQKGAQSAYGGVAGIEIKKDENGKTTVNFNPEKAIVGIIGMTAYKKLSPEIVQKLKGKMTDELKDLVSKELNNLDTSPLLSNRGFEGMNDNIFRLDQLKTKLQNKALSTSDILEAIPLLKTQKIDVMKDYIDKTINSKINILANDLTSSIKKAKASGQSFDEWVKKQPTVYHGTRENLKKFDNKQGTFFTDDYMNADGYASGENVYEGYINLKKPLVIDAKGKLHRELDTPYGKTTRDIVANVDEEKYDGVIFKNIKDSWVDDAEVDTPSTIYYAFKPRDSFVNRSQLKAEWDKIK